MQYSKQKKRGDLAVSDMAGESLQLLLKNITSLNRAVELQALLKESLNVIQNVMNTEASSLILCDQETGELIVSMPTGPVKRQIEGKRLSSGDGIAGWVIQNNQSYYTNDPENDSNFGGELSEDFTTRNLICTPLRKRDGDIFGVLQAINRDGDEMFSNKDVEIFETLAEQVALSIERIQELENLQRELKDRELLLREVHHRIKNNLSTITALIEMEFVELDKEHAEHILRKTCSRIESMTEVHDLLHNSGLSHFINLSAYLKRLAGKIEDTLSDPSKKVNIQFEADTVQLDSDRAISCGLMMNELLVNAYKHAFKNRPEGGIIFIKLKQTEDDYVNLTVSDNGIGIGKDVNFDDSESIGSWLINVLIRRLEASVDINHTEGTSFAIRFKK